MFKNIENLIDHTNLKPEATSKDIITLCAEAAMWNFKAVCVNPFFVKLAAENLKETAVKVCTVVGFPLGAETTASKVFQTKEAIANGASEIDMVINIGALKAEDYDSVLRDIREVVEGAGDALVKVIIETCLLTDEEKKKACELAVKAGAHFVKTSTGFGSKGATLEDVMLMKSVVGDKAEVKASGGIRDITTALKMIEAGASRIGTSQGVKIMEEKNITKRSDA
ncbi:MAG: deoxyribose-phosphate aldolase [Clostridia bacterium]|nr:deoxyribose-phosphate aldolase [Clostridia bacterium]